MHHFTRSSYHFVSQSGEMYRIVNEPSKKRGWNEISRLSFPRFILVGSECYKKWVEYESKSRLLPKAKQSRVQLLIFSFRSGYNVICTDDYVLTKINIAYFITIHSADICFTS